MLLGAAERTEISKLVHPVFCHFNQWSLGLFVCRCGKLSSLWSLNRILLSLRRRVLSFSFLVSVSPTHFYSSAPLVQIFAASPQLHLAFYSVAPLPQSCTTRYKKTEASKCIFNSLIAYSNTKWAPLHPCFAFLIQLHQHSTTPWCDTI